MQNAITKSIPDNRNMLRLLQNSIKWCYFHFATNHLHGCEQMGSEFVACLLLCLFPCLSLSPTTFNQENVKYDRKWPSLLFTPMLNESAKQTSRARMEKSALCVSRFILLQHTDVRSGNKKEKRKIDDENIICITIPKEIKQMKC